MGFWRGFGRIAGDFRTWDFGMSDLSDAMTMMHADQLTDENATEGERAAYNEMMGAIYNKEQAEQAYGGNASFWNRAGVMTGYMPSFMLDFVITGGGFDENIPRMLPEGARAVVKKDSYEIPPIFKMMQKKANIAEDMMYNTFNMGLGMVLAVNAEDVDTVVKAIESAGDKAFVVGNIEAGEKGVTLC